MKARILYAGQFLVWYWRRWQYALKYREFETLELLKRKIGDWFGWIIWWRVPTKKWGSICRSGPVPDPPECPRFNPETFPPENAS